MPFPPFDPVSLLALGVSTTALGLQGATAGRKYYRDAKEDRQRNQQGSTEDSPPFYVDNREISSCTSGAGQVFSLPDGTVVAGGRDQGDMTFTTIRSTKVVSLGTGKHANSAQGISQLVDTANARPAQSPAAQAMPFLLTQQIQMQKQIQQQPQQYVPADEKPIKKKK